MKTFALALALLVPAAAPAAPVPNACGKLITCGTFEGEGVVRDETGRLLANFRETVVIASKTEKDATMKITVVGNPNETTVYDLKLALNKDGTFRMTQSTRPYASGVCALAICSYGLNAFNVPNDKVAVANAGFLRFTKDGLERSMLTSASNGRQVQLSTLRRR